MTEMSNIDTNVLYVCSAPVKDREKNGEEKLSMDDMTIFSSIRIKDSGIFEFHRNANVSEESLKAVCYANPVSNGKVIIDADEKRILEELSKQFQKDKQEKPIEKAAQEYFENLREKFIMPSLERNLKVFLNKTPIDLDAIALEFQAISAFQSGQIEEIADSLADTSEKGRFLLAAKDDISKAHALYLSLLGKSLQNNNDKELIKNVFGSLSDMYSANQRIHIIDIAINANIKDDNLTDPAKYMNFEKETEKFLQDFYANKEKPKPNWFDKILNWLKKLKWW